VKYRLALTGLIMLAVAGCGLVSKPVVGGQGGCPVPTADTQLLKNEEHRYCLLYPKGYTAEQPNSQEMVIGSGSLQDIGGPRATITVSDAAGRPASEIADAVAAQVEASLPGWGVRQSAIMIGGENAIVLDNLPGQDIGRQVVVVHNGQHYSFTFVPAGPVGADAVQQMEQLYKTVMGSFRFTP
jgi:uncharacterized protein YceK